MIPNRHKRALPSQHSAGVRPHGADIGCADASFASADPQPTGDMPVGSPNRRRLPALGNLRRSGGDPCWPEADNAESRFRLLRVADPSWVRRFPMKSNGCPMSPRVGPLSEFELRVTTCRGGPCPTAARARVPAGPCARPVGVPAAVARVATCPRPHGPVVCACDHGRRGRRPGLRGCPPQGPEPGPVLLSSPAWARRLEIFCPGLRRFRAIRAARMCGTTERKGGRRRPHKSPASGETRADPRRTPTRGEYTPTVSWSSCALPFRNQGEAVMPKKTEMNVGSGALPPRAQEARNLRRTPTDGDRPDLRILRMSEVVERTTLSASTIYALLAEGRFPRPVRLGPRATGWPEYVIDAWLASRIAARDEMGTVHPVVSVPIWTLEMEDRYQGRDLRMLRLRTAVRRVGLRKSAIYRRIEEGSFPAPVPIGTRARAWAQHEVDAWIRARIDRRRADPGFNFLTTRGGRRNASSLPQGSARPSRRRAK